MGDDEESIDHEKQSQRHLCGIVVHFDESGRYC